MFYIQLCCRAVLCCPRSRQSACDPFQQPRAHDGDEQKVLEKLRDWKDPDSETTDHKRPLHQALAKGHETVAKHLIMYRADAWKKEGGKTAVLVALESQKESELLELLKRTHKDDNKARALRWWHRSVPSSFAQDPADLTSGSRGLRPCLRPVAGAASRGWLVQCAKAVKLSSRQLAGSRRCWTKSLARLLGEPSAGKLPQPTVGAGSSERRIGKHFHGFLLCSGSEGPDTQPCWQGVNISRLAFPSTESMIMQKCGLKQELRIDYSGCRPTFAKSPMSVMPSRKERARRFLLVFLRRTDACLGRSEGAPAFGR